jgi:hypothetical protein
MIVRRPFPVVPAVVSLAGLLFCLWVHLTGGESLCLTDGCTLFQDFRLAGFSLWQGGLVLFSLLLVLCLLRFVPFARLCASAALAVTGTAATRSAPDIRSPKTLANSVFFFINSPLSAGQESVLSARPAIHL